MTPDEARRLIEQGEGQEIEFKASLSGREEGIESLCAFANADGGTVFFGVRNDGTILGVSVGTNTLEELAVKIGRSLFPQTIPRIDELSLDGKTIIAVTVDRVGAGRVVFTGGPRVRSGRANLQLSWEEVHTRILTAEPDWSEERDRPHFEVVQSGGQLLEPVFEPRFKVAQVSGDPAANLKWRIRGPRFRMEWQQTTGSALGRRAFSWRFDLSEPPGNDAEVGLNEIGFEIGVHWRGRWRSELHRWPLTRQELPAPPRVHWNMGEEILPPLYFDDRPPSDSKE